MIFLVLFLFNCFGLVTVILISNANERGTMGDGSVIQLPDYSTKLEKPESSAPLVDKEAYGIVVGISNYPGTSNDLNYCDDDAQDIYDMLIDDYNFKSENVIYLQDSSASKSSISDAFDQISAVMGEDDLFFFYYSGHGGAETINAGTHPYTINSPHPYPNYYDHMWSIYHTDAAYMRVHFDTIDLENNWDYVYIGDTDLSDGWYYQSFTGAHTNIWSGWIPLLSDNRIYVRMISDNIYNYWGFEIDMYEVEVYDGTHFLCSYDSIPSTPSNYYIDSLLDSKLDTLSCSEKYVVIDACNSGGMIPEVQEVGRYIMTACNAEQSSVESSSLQHGVFTNYFLRAPDYATDTNTDGVISMEECYSYTYSNTVSYSSSLGYTHHPQQYDGISGESILATSFSSVTLSPTGGELSYSFNLNGIGSIEELKILAYEISSTINYQVEDLTLSAPTATGFGFYSGSLVLSGASNITGYSLYATVQGNELIELYEGVTGDYDGDTLPDTLEIAHGINPGSIDSDNDGLDDATEFYGVTDPIDSDSDDDGLSDGAEVNIYLTDPLNADTDGDGSSDSLEIAWGTDPLDPKISVTTIFLNIAGVIVLASTAAFIAISQVKSRKKRQDERFLKDKFPIKGDQESSNILTIRKITKPKPYSYGYTSPYARRNLATSLPRTPATQIDLNKIRNMILYGMPPPKSVSSEDGKKALMIANMAFDLMKKGEIVKSFDFMIGALTLGVPEPINSTIKKVLLDSLNQDSNKSTSNSSSQSSSQLTKKCNSCGQLNKESNKFCTKCGGVL